MRRAYKFRMRPTAGQHLRLQACLDSHRELYNAALQERRDAWRMCRKGVSYGEQSAQLRAIRTVRLDVATWSFSSEQATLRRLNRSFAGFFRRVKAAERPGYPRFKAAHRFDTVEWPKDGDGCRFHREARRVYLQGVGHVRVTLHRPVEGVVKTVSVKREGNKWQLVLSCEEVPTKPLPATKAVVGIDLGITSFLATSDEELVENPRWARKAAEGLGGAQQRLGRKTRGSKNRARAREAVAKRHRTVANQRRDFQVKLARRLVKDHDVLVIEDLKVKNMVRRPKPVPDPEQKGVFLRNRAAAKAGLNRSISDAGWGAFVLTLRAKAEEAGRTVLDVDPRHTSDRCHDCGHTSRENRVSQAVFRCRACGHEERADIHAARNILRAGLALLTAQAA